MEARRFKGIVVMKKDATAELNVVSLGLFGDSFV
jgi:hypothetical protein